MFGPGVPGGESQVNMGAGNPPQELHRNSSYVYYRLIV